jgi:hypothetical protein
VVPWCAVSVFGGPWGAVLRGGVDWTVSGFGAAAGRNAAEEVAADRRQVVSGVELGAREVFGRKLQTVCEGIGGMRDDAWPVRARVCVCVLPESRY